MKFEEMIKEMRASQTDVTAKWDDVFNASYVPVYDMSLHMCGTQHIIAQKRGLQKVHGFHIH